MVKASNGPRYVVGVRPQIDVNTLKVGTRVTLDISTLTIMRVKIQLWAILLIFLVDPAKRS